MTGAVPPGRPDDDLEEELDEIASGFSGRVGYAVADLSTGRRASRAGEEWFPTASAIKLPLLTVVHHLVAAGEISWDDELPVDPAVEPGGSGVLQYLDRPRRLSLRDAAWLMICVSDNLATNLVLDRIGFDRAARLLPELTGPGVRLDKPAGAVAGETAPTRSMGRARPAALLDYLLRLAGGDYAGAQRTIAVAAQQQSRSGIARHLPLESNRPDGRPGPTVTVAGKPGALPGVRTDIGLVRAGASVLALVVLTDGGADLTYRVDNEGEQCIGAISRAAVRAWLGVSA